MLTHINNSVNIITVKGNQDNSRKAERRKNARYDRKRKKRHKDGYFVRVEIDNLTERQSKLHKRRDFADAGYNSNHKRSEMKKG